MYFSPKCGEFADLRRSTQHTRNGGELIAMTGRAATGTGHNQGNPNERSESHEVPGRSTVIK